MVLWQREAPRIKWEGGDPLWLTNLSFFSEKLKIVDSVKSRWMKNARDCAMEKSIAKLLMGVKIFLMGVKRADPSDCPNSYLASPIEDFLSNNHMDINNISTVLTWDLSISSLEMMKDPLVFIWAEAHYSKPCTFHHKDVQDFLMQGCSYSQVPNQVAISPAAHVTSYFTSESRIFKMRVRFRGVALAKNGRDQIYGWLFYGFVQTCRRRPSDIHTHPLVLVSRSRIHDCLCWERNLVSLLDVAVSQRPKCLIYVWCC